MMTSADPDQNQDINEEQEETLQERSERLEAEAALGNFDHLSPEPLPEDDDDDLDALQEELAQVREQMLRAVAEAENTRRRAVREREDASKYAVSGFAKDMLSVADNLRRALEAVPEDLVGDDRIKGLVEGIEATERDLLRSFEKNGIDKLNPVDQVFDPNFHEVMFETPGTGKPAGTIIQVIETGYVLNGRLLRPARVGVAKDEGQGGGASTPASTGGSVDTEI